MSIKWSKPSFLFICSKNVDVYFLLLERERKRHVRGEGVGFNILRKFLCCSFVNTIKFPYSISFILIAATVYRNSLIVRYPLVSPRMSVTIKKNIREIEIKEILVKMLIFTEVPSGLTRVKVSQCCVGLNTLY